MLYFSKLSAGSGKVSKFPATAFHMTTVNLCLADEPWKILCLISGGPGRQNDGVCNHPQGIQKQSSELAAANGNCRQLLPILKKPPE